MNGLESRIDKLEKQTGIGKPEKPWLVVVYDDTGKPSEAKLEKAKAEYKAKHPDWQEQDFNVIWVKDAETKELTERLMAGEKPSPDLTDAVLRYLGLDPDVVRAKAKANGQSMAEVAANELGVSHHEFIKTLQLKAQGSSYIARN